MKYKNCGVEEFCPNCGDILEDGYCYWCKWYCRWEENDDMDDIIPGIDYFPEDDEF